MLALFEGSTFKQFVNEGSSLSIPFGDQVIYASPVTANWQFGDFRLFALPPKPATPDGKFETAAWPSLKDGLLEWEITYADIPVEVPIVPESISDRQFFQAVANRGLISKQEALAAVSVGALPAAMEAMLINLDEEEEFKARMLLQGATEFLRSNPLVNIFAAGFGMNSEEIDQLWIEASAL